MRQHQAARRRMGSAAFVLCALVMAFGSAAGARPPATYLIVERPDRLMVYNKYQQTITPQERRQLVPFVPMKIVRSNDVLGDGFTPCTTVEIHGELFYLVKGKEGELTGSSGAGSVKEIDAARVLGDTVHVLSGGTLTLAAPAGNVRHPLKRGDSLIRVFERGDEVFAGTVADPVRYGWTRLSRASRGEAWDVAPPVPAASGVIPERVLTEVQQKIREANRVYAGLFSFFDQQTGQRRPAPYWSVQSSDQAIVCVLENAPAEESFSRSTQYLVKDLQNAVLGTSLTVSHNEGRIEIRSGQ